MKACVPACVWRREEANTHTGSQACPEHEPGTHKHTLTQVHTPAVYTRRGVYRAGVHVTRSNFQPVNIKLLLSDA